MENIVDDFNVLINANLNVIKIKSINIKYFWNNIDKITLDDLK